jgi:hypothetical protein
LLPPASRRVAWGRPLWATAAPPRSRKPPRVDTRCHHGLPTPSTSCPVVLPRGHLAGGRESGRHPSTASTGEPHRREGFFPSNRLKLPINSTEVFSPFPTPSSSPQQRPIAPPPPPFAPPPPTSTAGRSLSWNRLLKPSPTKVSTGVDSPRRPLPFPPVPGRRRPPGRRQSPVSAGPAARSNPLPCLCSVR